jgi:hypothetical protein
VEHFEHCILGTAHTIAELNELEKYHIAAQGTLVPNGYNLTMGGEGSVGWSPSEETRTKISVSHMGMARKQSQEERAKRSANMTGKPRHHSDEWRKKRSLLMTGRKLSDSHRAAISEGNKGKKLSEAHRAKLRKPKSEDSKAKMKIAALRRYHPLLFNDLSLYTGSSR